MWMHTWRRIALRRALGWQEAQLAVVTRCPCGVSVQYGSTADTMCGRKHGGFTYLGNRPKCCNCVLMHGLCNEGEYRGDACGQCRRRAEEDKAQQVSAPCAAVLLLECECVSVPVPESE
jgi:hypothetical protein